MTGGIKRMATALNQFRSTNTVFVENGGLVSSDPPNGEVGVKQNRIKLEAIGDALQAMHVDAVAIGAEEARSGAGALQELQALTDQSVVCTSVANGSTTRVKPWIERHGLLIGAVTPAAEAVAAMTGGEAISSEVAAKALCAEANTRHLAPVLLYRGDQGSARALARAAPELKLIVFRSQGSATDRLLTEGATALVSPGDRARNLIALKFDGTHFEQDAIITLGPNYGDDPTVSAVYRESYLRRVTKSMLIEQLSRTKTARYAGNGACSKCHATAESIWHASAHGHALIDLERQGHDRDPDCLGCHVTGLGSTVGFRTRRTTPNLSNVTCEACHGPAMAHVTAPKKFRLAKVTPTVCLSCHAPDNSPNFSFDVFWKRIRHR